MHELFEMSYSQSTGMFLWHRPSIGRLSPHFTQKEFECQCGRCGPQVVDATLIFLLERIRSELGHPITVTSGYRCRAHQASLLKSGHPTVKVSQHMYGRAADIKCNPKHLKELLALCSKYFKAKGIAATWLHVDLRHDRHRYWEYT